MGFLWGRSFASLVLGSAALVLCGCQSDPNETAAPCPKLYPLPDATSFTHYDGRGTDIADVVLSARITDVRGACSGTMGRKEQGAHAHVVMVLTRGPAAKGREADVPYSVGVLRSGQILDERSYSQHVVFPANVDTVEVTGQEISFVLPTSKGVSGPSYHFYFWLNLSEDELAANRRQKK